MLDGAGEENVAQGNAVVVDVKAGDILGHSIHHTMIVVVIDVVTLAGEKAVVVLFGQSLPRGVKVGAVAGAALVIGGIQRFADVAVVFVA